MGKRTRKLLDPTLPIRKHSWRSCARGPYRTLPLSVRKRRFVVSLFSDSVFSRFLNNWSICVVFLQGNKKGSGSNTAAIMEQLRKEALQDAFLERAQKVRFSFFHYSQTFFSLFKLFFSLFKSFSSNSIRHFTLEFAFFCRGTRELDPTLPPSRMPYW